MIKIDKYFVSLEIEGDVVEKQPFLKGLGRWYFTLFGNCDDLSFPGDILE